jgi:photosystem II stability/assembly factor-like uncharacterized protein
MIDENLDLVFVLHRAGGTCFAGRRSGLYRLDAGDWRPAYDSMQLEGNLSTTAIASSDSLVFAGVLGGILRSDDSGAAWQAFQLPEPASMVGSLLLTSDFPQTRTVLAGTTEDGIYRSDDGGLTWLPSNIGLYDRHVLCLAQAGESVLAGTETGLYRSHNQGQSWQPVDFAQEPATVLSLFVDSQGAILVGTETQGLYRSIDSGQSWIRLGETAFAGAINALVAADDRLLALVDDRLWQSTDGGAEWDPVLDDTGITAVTQTDDGSLNLGYEDGSIIQHKQM